MQVPHPNPISLNPGAFRHVWTGQPTDIFFCIDAPLIDASGGQEIWWNDIERMSVGTWRSRSSYSITFSIPAIPLISGGKWKADNLNAAKRTKKDVRLRKTYLAIRSTPLVLCGFYILFSESSTELFYCWQLNLTTLYLSFYNVVLPDPKRIRQSLIWRLELYPRICNSDIFYIHIFLLFLPTFTSIISSEVVQVLKSVLEEIIKMVN